MLVPAHAYGFAGTLRPREAVQLIGECEARRVTKSLALARRPSGGVAVVHDFGAVVFFGFDEAERTAALGRLLASCPPEPHPPLLDDYLVEVIPGSPPSTTFDRAVVPDLDDDTLELISLVLAQSVAMDYYDADVAEMLRRAEGLAADLAQHGRFRTKTREVLRFVGSALVTRSQIATTLSLLDAPAVTWEREESDRLHRALRASFEIEDRYRTLQHELQIIQDNLSIIADLSHGRRAELLEIAVVALILVEVLAGLVGGALRLGERRGEAEPLPRAVAPAAAVASGPLHRPPDVARVPPLWMNLDQTEHVAGPG